MVPSSDFSSLRFAALRLKWLAGASLFRILASAVLLLGLAALAVFLAWHRSPRGDHTPAAPPADPRLTYTGRFLNVHPSVAYVGDTACADCHDTETRSYRKHPMGRSLAPIREALGQTLSNGVDAAFTAFNSRFTIERRGDQLFHVETRLDAAGKPIYTLRSEVQYVVGSGTRGYSYLSERQGFLFQTPISWFSQKRIWGLAPGFMPVGFAGRPIRRECLFCHANRTQPRPDTVNGYDPPVFQGHAIGCERCHGPGGQHIQQRSNAIALSGDMDLTIFNPSKKKHRRQVEPALRDAVCEQCHLSGEARVLRRGRDVYDFRPAMPLQQFWAILVRDRIAEGAGKAVNHVEQMHESRCYQQSAGADKLECVSCHNPHENVTAGQRVSYYRARCLECHETHGCSVPLPQRLRHSKEDSCIDCHMPRYSAADIPHTAATDHRIVRRHEPTSGGAQQKSLIPSYKLFYERSGDDRELARDRAVALMRVATGGKGEPRVLAQQALDLLVEPLAACPDDIDAWEAQGSALDLLGRPSEALLTFEKVLEQRPSHEHALHAAAWMAEQTGNLDKAIDYWRRAAQRNPQGADYHGNLARLLAYAGNWEEARDHCQTWLRLDPGNVGARKLLVRCLRRQGDRQAALREMELLRRLEQ